MLSAASPPCLLVPLFAWRIGRSFKKEVMLVCSRVNEINIPAAPDLGSAQRELTEAKYGSTFLSAGPAFRLWRTSRPAVR